MNGRERMQAVLGREATDRVPWTALVDRCTLDALPEDQRGLSALDFYGEIGCDTFLLNGYGNASRLSSPTLRWSEDVAVEEQVEGDRRTREWLTPQGVLTQTTRRGHPIKYPVTTLEDLRVYREMWEGARFTAMNDRPAFNRLYEAVKESGVITRFWGPSTIPRLLEMDMGTENFYYLLADHREEMEQLFALMHERELEAFEHLADGPADVVILCENTSTHYISPEVYRKYNLPHVRDFVDTVHATGKTAIIHMCGHVKNLLQMMRDTNMDGIHALTPPPTGDTPWEMALDVLGEDLVIIGAMDPTVFASGPVKEIGPALKRLLTPRLRKASFVLCTFADGIAVPLERFRAVAAWMEKHGAH